VSMSKADMKDVLEAAKKVTSAMEMSAAISGDLRDGESAPAWVKRVIRERDEAREKLRRIRKEVLEMVDWSEKRRSEVWSAGMVEEEYWKGKTAVLLLVLAKIDNVTGVRDE
jgi:hypothetical protein